MCKGRRVAAFLAGPAFQGGFQLPDWRVPRPADGIERQAGAGLTAIVFDLDPAQPAVEALRDGWRPPVLGPFLWGKEKPAGLSRRVLRSVLSRYELRDPRLPKR
jgi:hypothetical protein